MTRKIFQDVLSLSLSSSLVEHGPFTKRVWGSNPGNASFIFFIIYFLLAISLLYLIKNIITSMYYSFKKGIELPGFEPQTLLVKGQRSTTELLTLKHKMHWNCDIVTIRLVLNNGAEVAHTKNTCLIWRHLL